MCSPAMAQQRIPANFRGFAKRRAAMATLPALRSGTPLCLLTSHVVCFRARTRTLSLSLGLPLSLSVFVLSLRLRWGTDRRSASCSGPPPCHGLNLASSHRGPPRCIGRHVLEHSGPPLHFEQVCGVRFGSQPDIDHACA